MSRAVSSRTFYPTELETLLKGNMKDNVWTPVVFSDDEKIGKWSWKLTKIDSIMKIDLKLACTTFSEELYVKYVINLSGQYSTLEKVFNVNGECLFNIKTKSQQTIDLVPWWVIERVVERYKPYATTFMVLTCEIIVHVKEGTDSDIHCTSDEVCKDLEKLLVSPEFSDFSLVTPKKTFKVHRNIIAMRSPVFYKMLTNDMTEKNSGSVEIKDLDEKVAEELLRYIYCGKVLDLESIAQELLVAADKYMLDGLKMKCLEKICEDLKNDNAIKLLCLADNFGADRLKPKIINFIIHNLEEIIDTEDYKLLEPTNVLKDMVSRMITVSKQLK